MAKSYYFDSLNFTLREIKNFDWNMLERFNNNNTNKKDVLNSKTIS